MSLPFRDRHDAGRQLADQMSAFTARRAVVLGVPRGGVPVAYEVAHVLRAQLDIFMMRQLVVPGAARIDIGIVASGGVRVLRADAIERSRIAPQLVDQVTQRERISLIARERTYRGQNVVPELRGRVVVLVDDGAMTLRALQDAVAALREHEPQRVVLAVPALAAATLDQLRRTVDDMYCVVTAPAEMEPKRWYREFLPISHTEVRALLSLSLAEGQSRELAGAGSS
jgi:putative phosphoribosyl transferase